MTDPDVQVIARKYTEDAIRALAEIMHDPSADPKVRAEAATQILNRGYGALIDHERVSLSRLEFYVYSIHNDDGKLIYIGKGVGGRARKSAERLNGKHRVRAVFSKEAAALKFEARLIRCFRPIMNVVYNRAGNESYQTFKQ